MTLQFSQQIFPQHKVYGIEAYKPGVKFLRDQKIGAEYGDAADIIEKFKNKTISQIYMLFPDPWQKISIESEDYSTSIFLANTSSAQKKWSISFYVR